MKKAEKSRPCHFFSLSLQFSREELGETVTVSKMLFHPKINDHEKEISCRAENTEILSSAIDDNKLLNVHCKIFISLLFLRLPTNGVARI